MERDDLVYTTAPLIIRHKEWCLNDVLSRRELLFVKHLHLHLSPHRSISYLRCNTLGGCGRVSGLCLSYVGFLMLSITTTRPLFS
jgi:hypothetical protein